MSDPDRASGNKLTVARRRDRSGSGPGIVDDLLVTLPVIGSADMPVREAAALMTERGQDHLVIPLTGGTYGLLTDADIRAGVVAVGRDIDTPVGELVAGPVPVVPQGTAAVDALTVMFDRDLTAMPVVDPAGAVVGVLGLAVVVAAATVEHPLLVRVARAGLA